MTPNWIVIKEFAHGWTVSVIGKASALNGPLEWEDFSTQYAAEKYAHAMSDLGWSKGYGRLPISFIP